MPAPTPTRLLAAALLCLCLAAPPAGAQVQQINPNTASALTLSPAQRTEIDTFIANLAPDLTAEDFTRVKRARDALLAPLAMPNISVAFRQAYARALWPHVSALLTAEPIESRLTGMRLAGAMGTEEPTAALIELLSSDDDGVRVFAAQRLGAALQTATSNAAGISPETAARLVDALGAVVRQDPVLHAADVAARSLGVAVALEQQALGGVRDRAVRVLAESAGARMQRVAQQGQEASDEMLAALRVAGMLRAAVSDLPPTAEAAKSVIGFGGDTLAAVFRTLRNADPAADRALEVRVVRAAEGVVYFARRAGEPTVQPTDFAAVLEQERGIRAFQNEVARFLGPGSALTSRYGFAADRFIGA